jgi:hypothetical protein
VQKGGLVDQFEPGRGWRHWWDGGWRAFRRMAVLLLANFVAFSFLRSVKKFRMTPIERSASQLVDSRNCGFVRVKKCCTTPEHTKKCCMTPEPSGT